MGYSPTRLFDGEEEEFNVKIDRFSFIVKIIHRGEFETAGQGRDVGRMLQCLNTVFTQAMMSNWISVENDPKTFFLKDNEQRELLNRNILQKYLRSSYSPYVGLAQSAFFSDGKFTVAYNNKMDWLCKAGHPILDVHKQELAGVRIDIQNKINNQATREAITKKLKKMVFQINFTKGPKWEEGKKL